MCGKVEELDQDGFGALDGLLAMQPLLKKDRELDLCPQYILLEAPSDPVA